MKNFNPERVSELRSRLDGITSGFSLTQEIENDPLALVIRFAKKEDREVAAFVAACFSYGNVKQIQRSVGTIFSILGPEPYSFLVKCTPESLKEKIPPHFRHRFNSAKDLACLLLWLSQALKEWTSLESLFTHNADFSDGIQNALDSFIGHLTQYPTKPYVAKKEVLFLVPKPSGKSACKRMLLFLRWVCGTGPMDLGIWTKVPKKHLVIPLDTHVLRISRHLGFTKRKDNTWRTAVEITEALKLLDPADPTRFDFAICHLGISQECPSRFNKNVCPQCRMNDVCVTSSRMSSKTSGLAKR